MVGDEVLELPRSMAISTIRCVESRA